jgi:hypothetical protein
VTISIKYRASRIARLRFLRHLSLQVQRVLRTENAVNDEAHLKHGMKDGLINPTKTNKFMFFWSPAATLTAQTGKFDPCTLCSCFLCEGCGCCA